MTTLSIQSLLVLSDLLFVSDTCSRIGSGLPVVVLHEEESNDQGPTILIHSDEDNTLDINKNLSDQRRIVFIEEFARSSDLSRDLSVLFFIRSPNVEPIIVMSFLSIAQTKNTTFNYSWRKPESEQSQRNPFKQISRSARKSGCRGR